MATAKEIPVFPVSIILFFLPSIATHYYLYICVCVCVCVNDIIGTGLIELDKILILIVTLVLEPLLLLALEGCLLRRLTIIE